MAEAAVEAPAFEEARAVAAPVPWNEDRHSRGLRTGLSGSRAASFGRLPSPAWLTGSQDSHDSYDTLSEGIQRGRRRGFPIRENGLALTAPGVYCTDIQYGARPWTFVRVLGV